MTTSAQKKFLVLYLAPANVLADWAKTDPAVKKAAEEKMRAEWQRWMSEHAKMITSTEAGGKTKAVTSAESATPRTTSCCVRSSRRTTMTSPPGRLRSIRTCRSRNPRSR